MTYFDAAVEDATGNGKFPFFARFVGGSFDIKVAYPTRGEAQDYIDRVVAGTAQLYHLRTKQTDI